MWQYFGSGGSPSAAVDTASQANSLTTSWQRFTQTVAIPSISGKTIGTNPDSSLQLHLYLPITAGSTIDLWGVQVEAEAVATDFATASGNSPQGELAMCQRYLPAIMVGSGNRIYGYGTGPTQSLYNATFPVTARVAPTGITAAAVANFTLLTSAGATGTPTSLVFDSAGVNSISLTVNNTAASPTMAANTVSQLAATGSGAFILFTGCEL
jgi:hypothetical protein